MSDEEGSVQITTHQTDPEVFKNHIPHLLSQEWDDDCSLCEQEKEWDKD